MKLKYFIPSLIALTTVLLTSSCSEDNDPTYLSEIRVSQSYVAFPAEGGEVKIDLSTTGDWNFKKQFQKITKNDDGSRDTTYLEAPEWLTISAVSGAAGTQQLTLTATAADKTREATLLLLCGSATQRINLIQMTEKAEAKLATCAEVLSGNEGTAYRVKGVCTAILNTTYGNWNLTDETGTVYVYGTLDKKGATKNFSSWGMEVGDIVTVEGPMKNYNGTIELVDVTVISIEKSLIKIDSLSTTEPLPLDGGDVTVFLTNKGAGYVVEIPEDAQDWLFIKSFTPGFVTLHALANTGGDRSATITAKTEKDGVEYTSQTVISQKGAIVGATVAEFLAAEVGDTQYRLTGVITKVDKAAYGNIYLRDFSGEVYIYGVGAKGDFEAAGLKEGDVVTLVGKRAVYNETPQMKGGVLESSISVTKVTIEEFLTKEDSKDVYYMVSGTLDEIVNPTYGNVYLKDGDTRLYVYGCYPGWGATGDNRKNYLETAGIAVGDKLTVIGVKSTYNEQPQVANGIYFSHEKAEEE